MKKKKVFWGILILLASVGLILLAFFPDFNIFAEISAWKIVLGVIFLYWIIDRLIFGKKFVDHFDIFIPLGVGFLIFESDIARLMGRSDGNLVNNWLIIAIALGLTIAVHLLFGHISVKKCITINGKRYEYNGGKYHKNTIGDKVIYFDVSTGNSFAAKNTIGEMNIFFQNADSTADNSPVTLDVSNSIGEITVHVPADWNVDLRIIDTSIGEINNRTRKAENAVRELVIIGQNSIGEINIVNI